MLNFNLFLLINQERPLISFLLRLKHICCGKGTKSSLNYTFLPELNPHCILLDLGSHWSLLGVREPVLPYLMSNPSGANRSYYELTQNQGAMGSMAQEGAQDLLTVCFHLHPLLLSPFFLWCTSPCPVQSLPHPPLPQNILPATRRGYSLPITFP